MKRHRCIFYWVCEFCGDVRSDHQLGWSHECRDEDWEDGVTYSAWGRAYR